MARAAAGSRIASVDLLRGAAMILMAIDHVRVYSGLPAGGPSAGIFFPRWITHFCAPAFVFLAGTSAYLYGRKHGGVSRFLLLIQGEEEGLVVELPVSARSRWGSR